jgi:hypothetical protein
MMDVNKFQEFAQDVLFFMFRWLKKRKIIFIIAKQIFNILKKLNDLKNLPFKFKMLKFIFTFIKFI